MVTIDGEAGVVCGAYDDAGSADVKKVVGSLCYAGLCGGCDGKVGGFV